MDSPIRNGKNRRLLKDETHKECGLCGEMIRHEDFVMRYGKPATWCRECQRWHTIQKRYGVTKDEWMAMRERQNGLCAICDTPVPMTPSKESATDHDHVTGAVRGILCVGCNTALGWVERAGVERFASYLATN